MALYEVGQESIKALENVTFGSAGVYERRDLQRLLRENIDILAPDTMVLAEEFGDWDDSKRRIDLLALDTDANLVVIELKRTETGGHMELQAVRYAAMVAKMTFQQAVEAHARYLATVQREADAEASILGFLGWDEPAEELFANDIRIVLASAEFSMELATAVLWLNEHGLDIRCVRMKPYSLDGRLLIDVQQVLPLPEAEDYQVKIREKVAHTREGREGGRDTTRFDLKLDDTLIPNLPKRRLILAIVHRVISHYGVMPERLAEFSPPHSRMWITVDRHVQSQEEFIEATTAKRSLTGRPVDIPRFFTERDDLILADGKTYALTKMWGGGTWRRAIEAIRENVPGISIEYHPTQS